MSLLLFFALNLVLMATLFVFGVYQFMQVEEKRKRRRLLADANLNESELQALVQAERHEEALTRLMSAGDFDRFTAEAALAQLKDRRTATDK